MNYGYARVSTAGQDLAGQLAQLAAAGCDEIREEKASAAGGRRRPELARLVDQLKPGDVLTVVRLNRFARSARDALNVLAAVTGKGAGFRSLGEPWADTTTPAGRFLVTVFAGLAEFDRETILERTAEGRASAKARGVKLGRRHRLSPAQRRYVRQVRRQPAPPSIGQLQHLFGVSRATIRRALMEGDDEAGGPIWTPPADARDPRQVDLEDLTGR